MLDIIAANNDLVKFKVEDGLLIVQICNGPYFTEIEIDRASAERLSDFLQDEFGDW